MAYMFCPECGNRTEENARFCPNCGAALPWQKGTALTGARLGLVIVAVLVAVAIVAAVTVMIVNTVVNPAKPFSTVEKFADAYNRCDFNAMIGCIDPRITDAITGLVSGTTSFLGAPTLDKGESAAAVSLLGDLISKNANDYGNQGWVTSQMTVSEVSTVMNGEDSAEVTAEFTVQTSSGDTKTWRQDLSMVKIDGKWYITVSLSGISNALGAA